MHDVAKYFKDRIAKKRLPYEHRAYFKEIYYLLYFMIILILFFYTKTYNFILYFYDLYNRK